MTTINQGVFMFDELETKGGSMKTITQAWDHYILHGHWDNNARKEYENLVGTEHADELEVVEPAYEWVRPGEQCTDILNAIKASLNIDSE
jgi:hypothetical protein